MGIPVIHWLLLWVVIYMKEVLVFIPSSYCILFYGTIIISQTGLWSPLLSFPPAEYMNAANIPGLLRRTDRYLIWEANPKQYTLLSWLSWLYNWLTETQWGSEALMPRSRLLIHSDCQQWSLILWSLSMPVHIDCIESIPVQYLTHLPAFLALSQPSPAFFLFRCRSPLPDSHQCISRIRQIRISQLNAYDNAWHKGWQGD